MPHTPVKISAYQAHGIFRNSRRQSRREDCFSKLVPADGVKAILEALAEGGYVVLKGATNLTGDLPSVKEEIISNKVGQPASQLK